MIKNSRGGEKCIFSYKFIKVAQYGFHSLCARAIARFLGHHDACKE